MTVDEVCDTFIDQTRFFECAVVREQVFQLRALRLVTQAQFNELEKQKQEIEAKELFRHRALVAAMTSFYTMQLLVGYHCIFNVEWLGWDLVEPVTFTVG